MHEQIQRRVRTSAAATHTVEMHLTFVQARLGRMHHTHLAPVMRVTQARLELLNVVLRDLNHRVCTRPPASFVVLHIGSTMS